MMDEQARHAAFMSALVTEHFVLQSVAWFEVDRRQPSQPARWASSAVGVGVDVLVEAIAANLLADG
jgi:hypothetical protein